MTKIIQVSEFQIQQFLLRQLNPKLAVAKVLEISRDAETNVFSIHLQVEEPEPEHYLPPQPVDPTAGPVKLIYDHVWGRCPECHYTISIHKNMPHASHVSCEQCGLIIAYTKDADNILTLERAKYGD